jgi:hypothetical protein
MRHKNGRGGRFLTENIKGDGTPEGVQERADSTTAVSDFSFT